MIVGGQHAYDPPIAHSQNLAGGNQQQPSGGSEIITGPGEWTLGRLGYRDTSVDASGGRKNIAFLYQTPVGEQQGPGRWWHLRLRFRIQFQHRAAEPVYVSASTQGRYAAQVEFEPGSDPGRVTWNSVTLTGRSDGNASLADEIEIQTENYLQYEGVAGGMNKLEVVLEQPADTAVSHLTVLASTAIVVDNDSPFDLALKVPVPKGRVREGDTFELAYILTNSDTQPATDVKLRVNIFGDGGLRFRDDPSLEPDGQREKSIPLGDVSGTASGIVRLRADKPGAYDVVLTAAGSAANDRDGVRIRAIVYGRGGFPGWGVLASLLILAVGAALYYRSSQRVGSRADKRLQE